jgi:hypothetical protein
MSLFSTESNSKDWKPWQDSKSGSVGFEWKWNISYGEFTKLAKFRSTIPQ